MGVEGLVGSNCARILKNVLLFCGLMFAQSICPIKTAFAVNADAKITGMLETYMSLIGYTAENPLYFVETIGISIFIPCV